MEKGRERGERVESRERERERERRKERGERERKRERERVKERERERYHTQMVNVCTFDCPNVTSNRTISDVYVNKSLLFATKINTHMYMCIQSSNIFVFFLM